MKVKVSNCYKLPCALLLTCWEGTFSDVWKNHCDLCDYLHFLCLLLFRAYFSWGNQPIHHAYSWIWRSMVCCLHPQISLACATSYIHSKGNPQSSHPWGKGWFHWCWWYHQLKLQRFSRGEYFSSNFSFLPCIRLDQIQWYTQTSSHYDDSRSLLHGSSYIMPTFLQALQETLHETWCISSSNDSPYHCCNFGYKSWFCTYVRSAGTASLCSLFWYVRMIIAIQEKLWAHG